jgi:MraZ protein
MAVDGELQAIEGEVEAAPVRARALPRYGHRRLRGHFDLKLDKTGRIAIPGAFRHAFLPGPDQCVIAPMGGQVLGMWTADAFDIYLEEAIEDDAWATVDVRDLRWMEMMARDVSIDSQHRIVIPPELRDDSDLGDRIVLGGAGDRVEIWNAEAFAAEKREYDPRVRDTHHKRRMMRR